MRIDGAWKRWVGGGLASAAVALDSAPAEACHEEPDVPGYEDQVGLGFHLGIAFGSGRVRLAYGADVRVGSGQSIAVARLEGRGMTSARLVFAGQRVTDANQTGEVGLAFHSGHRAGDVGSSLGLHLGIGVFDGGAGAHLAGGIPFSGDLRNYDIAAQGYLVPNEIELCLAGGRRLRNGHRCVVPDVAVLDDAPDEPTERAIAEAWLEDARAEHASIYAFERMAAELRIAGAPDALVAGALAARDDEIRHARLCSELAGMPHWLLPLDDGHAAPRSRRPSAELSTLLAVEAWQDGCVGEGIAAAQALRAARFGRGASAAAQRRIAADERRHAELSWSVLEWLWHDGDVAVRDRIAQLAEQGALVPEVAAPAGDPDRLTLSGRLPGWAARQAAVDETERAGHRLRTLVAG